MHPNCGGSLKDFSLPPMVGGLGGVRTACERLCCLQRGPISTDTGCGCFAPGTGHHLNPLLNIENATTEEQVGEDTAPGFSCIKKTMIS